MTETVDQAQAQPPRALAGIIEDATSLSFVSTSHFGGSRGGRLPHGHAVLRQSSHISTGGPCTTSVDIKPEDARLDDTSSAAPVKLTVGRGGAGAQDGTPAAPVRARSPKCFMNHACGPSTSQAITAPSCMTPTATTSKPLAAPPDSDRRRACRHLPVLTTVRLLQARVEPEHGWPLQRR
jgi:hypothetical protein